MIRNDSSSALGLWGPGFAWRPARSSWESDLEARAAQQELKASDTINKDDTWAIIRTEVGFYRVPCMAL